MDLITSYRDFTEAIKAFSGMPPELLHVHAGMAIYLGSQFALGSRRASWLALLAVLGAELANEAMNRLYYGSWRWDDTASDVLWTLFWPSLCILVGRYRRWRWNAKRRRALAWPLPLPAIAKPRALTSPRIA